MSQSQPSALRTADRSERIIPGYLYAFNVNGSLIHLTNFDRDVTVTSFDTSWGSATQVFTSGQIKHGEISHEAYGLSPETQISVGIDDNAAADELVKYFIGPAAQKILGRIWRVNTGSLVSGSSIAFTDAYLIMDGEKSGVGINGRIVSMGLKSLAKSEKRKAPRIFFQPTCNHDLGTQGDGFCQVDIESADNKLASTVSGIDRVKKAVEMASTSINGNPIDEETFQGGLLRELDGPGGTVIAQMGIQSVEDLGGGTGFRLRLTWISQTLVDGTNTDIEVIRGCDKTRNTCLNKFNNLENFLGTPYIPINNPVIEGIRV